MNADNRANGTVKHGLLPAGVKKTRQRESVLAVLEESQRPLSAPEIYAAIAQKGEETGEDAAWMSTVYRALDLLVRKGAVTKLNLSSGGSALYELNRPKHRHYAVCVGCHKMVAIHDDCPLGEYVPRVADDGFQVTGHTLEVYGYCKDCKPAS